MLLAITALVFLAVGSGLLYLVQGFNSRLDSLQSALPYRDLPSAPATLPREMARSLWDRFLGPQLSALSRLLGAVLPSGMIERTEERLDRAGRPAHLTAAGYLTLQALLLTLAAAATLLLLRLYPLRPPLQTVLPLALPVMVALLPNYLLDRLAAARRSAVRRALPDTLDLLVVSVEAGMSLDAALREYLLRERGPLAQELARAQDEIRAGRTRERAWHDMALRVGLTELTTFVSAVCQGERLGASVAHVLHTQADSMRTARSLYVRELAAKIPVKMLFPMVFFIFPCLFVVMLGPGVIQILHNFRSFSS